ncbi:ABC transporter ATP-binding protein [Abyssicoccus albus]|uniref:Iron complex transport system ATP-binding protein n=1 Tax=Abyssicoccus albus TaxID=1817405 RepID=A0A3N5BI03_9BACL|nr:ATP-binding cassette domain-containing protein [Abyssicoccus albus]RPF57456.1 iron complex transport system ATP-binding protein [Abyssicoccus albus]
MISLQNLSKKFDKTQVINDVTVEIEKGKITSFVGPNGAGKSTLLSMISRLVAQDSGEVLLEGSNIKETPSPQLAKKVSILKQSNHLQLRITVQELIEFGRFPYTKGKLKEEDHNKVNEAIEYMQLDDLRHRYLDELSGGQRQRAYIAMTIAQDTEYILLDEPLNNLDMKHSVQIMQTLRRLVRELNKTVIIVIHDINFASCYSDNIVALKDGAIVANGKKDEVINSDMLKKIYDMDINIECIYGQQICVYFDNEENPDVDGFIREQQKLEKAHI